MTNPPDDDTETRDLGHIFFDAFFLNSVSQEASAEEVALLRDAANKASQEICERTAEVIEPFASVVTSRQLDMRCLLPAPELATLMAFLTVLSNSRPDERILLTRAVRSTLRAFEIPTDRRTLLEGLLRVGESNRADFEAKLKRQEFSQ